jgi:uncharacterized damage-inducible protein DinB
VTNAQLLEQFALVRRILNNARKQIELIPEDTLSFRPTPEVRTLGELCVHLHGFLTVAPKTVAAGKHVHEPAHVFTKKADLLAWIDAQVKEAFAILPTLTDEQLAATIETWGMTFTGAQILGGVLIEVLHHRGQLTVYLRLIGIPPVSIYDFS